MSVKIALLVLLVTFYDAEALTDERQGNGGNVRTQLAFPCPEPEDIAPCTCSYDTGENPDLDCSLVDSDEQLASVFDQEFPVQAFREFRIDDNDNIIVLSDIFRNNTFEQIYLYNINNLRIISDEMFLKSENTLERIAIYYSELTQDSFPISSVSMLKKLNYFRMDHSDFTAYPKLESESLTDVIITNSPITELPADSFDLLPQITSWGVYGDNIATLRANTFRLKNDYNMIRAYTNGLTTIEPGTFVLPSNTDACSVYIHLGSNQLRLVEEEVFGAVAPYWTDLYLTDNPLECGCDMAWLVTNPDYLSGVTAYCSDGTDIHDLDPQLYLDYC